MKSLVSAACLAVDRELRCRTMIFKKLFLVGSMALLPACHSYTRIQSSDPEAMIRVDSWGIPPQKGVLLGGDSGPNWKRTMVVVEKPGCLPSSYVINKGDDSNGGAFFGGFVTYGILWFWVGAYAPSYILEYSCRPSGVKP